MHHLSGLGYELCEVNGANVEVINNGTGTFHTVQMRAECNDNIQVDTSVNWLKLYDGVQKCKSPKKCNTVQLKLHCS